MRKMVCLMAMVWLICGLIGCAGMKTCERNFLGLCKPTPEQRERLNKAYQDSADTFYDLERARLIMEIKEKAEKLKSE